MVVLNVHLDNILVFNDFSLCLSYPKKPVNSTISEEHLAGRSNFRYKKIIVLMGANATGKTALGYAMSGIFNFISRKDYVALTELIEDNTKDASFSVDLAFPNYQLYRVTATFKGGVNKLTAFKSTDIEISVKSEKILKNDSYERCSERLTQKEEQYFDNYIQALESIPFLTWKFELPFASSGRQSVLDPVAPEAYAVVLEKTLKALDPRIDKVEKIGEDNNTFLIRFQNHSVLIKDGIVQEAGKLSSGTAEGIGVADLITAMKLRAAEFMFCDEKFSHLHSAAEKAFLSLLIDLIGPNQQMFFTTHNTDVLDMNIPFHSYAFLRRDEYDENRVTSVFASDYLKKNNVSLKNAVENDLFSTNPDTDDIYRISDLFEEGMA